MYYSKSDTAVTVDSHYVYNYILFLLMAMASKRGKNLLQLEPYPNLESRSETKARHPDKGLTKSTTWATGNNPHGDLQLHVPEHSGRGAVWLLALCTCTVLTRRPSPGPFL
jgi:hypothetical protein